jgi:uncharacterized membrane protein YGL010W
VRSPEYLARALVIGTVSALLFDALLRNALAGAQSPGAASLTPWWVVGRVVERGVWVWFALLLWAVSPLMARVGRGVWPGQEPGAAVLYDVVGRAMMIVPFLWLAASVLMVGLRISIQGDWSIDGEVFRSVSFYNNVVLEYLPWFGGGYVLMLLRRHVAA